jgi:hypothetical protein
MFLSFLLDILFTFVKMTTGDTNLDLVKWAGIANLKRKGLSAVKL